MALSGFLWCLLRDPRGWYGGTVTVSSTGYNDGPWLRTMLLQASDNCRLPAMPISVGIAGMAELQICIVPF